VIEERGVAKSLRIARLPRWVTHMTQRVFEFPSRHSSTWICGGKVATVKKSAASIIAISPGESRSQHLYMPGSICGKTRARR
jgi:hypothetical protein